MKPKIQTDFEAVVRGWRTGEVSAPEVLSAARRILDSEAGVLPCRTVARKPPWDRKHPFPSQSRDAGAADGRGRRPVSKRSCCRAIRSGTCSNSGCRKTRTDPFPRHVHGGSRPLELSSRVPSGPGNRRPVSFHRRAGGTARRDFFRQLRCGRMLRPGVPVLRRAGHAAERSLRCRRSIAGIFERLKINIVVTDTEERCGILQESSQDRRAL